MQWKCAICGQTKAVTIQRWRCDCGGVLECDFTPQVQLDAWARREPGMWRYAEALPLYGATPVSLGEPATPLVPLELEGGKVLVKQEQLFSTGSYKDRGAALLLTMARHLGVGSVVEDSSGNAGCAVSAYAARAGIRCEVFVPESTSSAKLAQMEAYGATVTKVPGSREMTACAVLEAAKTRFYASHTYNPWFIEGVKTFGYELADQLGYKAPDWVVLPAGNGTLLLGCFRAFSELVAAGVWEKMPRLAGVQSTACSPLVQAFRAGLAAPCEVQPAPTVAEGIAIAEPQRGWQMLQAVALCGGLFQAIDDEETMAARRWAALRGFFVEPTAAIALAATSRLLREGRITGTVVTVFTGHGLKHAH